MSELVSRTSAGAALAFLLALGVARPGLAEPPAPASAPPAQATALLERGLAAYEDGRFDEAVAAFEAGYALDPRPELLFALAQAARRGGDCARALREYRRFLATDPPPAQRRAAEMSMERCQEQRTVTPAATARAAPAPSVTPAASPVRDDPRRWYADVTGGALLGAGMIGSAAGVGFLVAASSARAHADDAETYGEFDRQLTRAKRNQVWGVATLLVGAALTGGAIYRYHTLAADEDDGVLTVVPSTGGGAITFSGRF